MDNLPFHSFSNRYFNTGILNRMDKLFSAVNPAWPFQKNVSFIKNHYGKPENPVKTSKPLSYTIEKYNGTNSTAIEISNYLQKHLEEELVCAVVHGSVSSDEVINYSDFDGLVIIKNEVFNDVQKIKYVATHLSKSYSLMIKGDPLQHHGWFVLTEKDISSWPAAYFPPEILEHSKSLLKFSVCMEVAATANKPEIKSNLFRMVNSITRMLSDGTFPSNTYQLKSLLSEFMLLPTLYLQAKTGKGIYKKFSFDEARQQVPPVLWKSMDAVSAIRNTWNCNSGLQLKQVPVLVTPALKKNQIKYSQHVPATLNRILTTELSEGMVKLAHYFENNIK